MASIEQNIGNLLHFFVNWITKHNSKKSLNRGDKCPKINYVLVEEDGCQKPVANHNNSEMKWKAEKNLKV